MKLESDEKGLKAMSFMMSPSNLALVLSIAPQGLVPVFPIGTFFMIPPTGGTATITAIGSSNQPQFWAISATATPIFNISGWPNSNFVSAIQVGMNMSFSTSTTTTTTTNPTVIIGGTVASTDNTESGENFGGKISISTTMAPSLRGWGFEEDYAFFFYLLFLKEKYCMDENTPP
ncbi:unnamed protein product [Fraxinus pennsylvanica]|uniref:Uncharacterized protein n=1 Tax=Fraxinus pennsylvanica TaxID=56036 RepID=A0AAD2DK57_9LAMI|nr:unnamed protein product [Fraxinus pennsylvanica]